MQEMSELKKSLHVEVEQIRSVSSSQILFVVGFSSVSLIWKSTKI